MRSRLASRGIKSIQYSTHSDAIVSGGLGSTRILVRVIDDPRRRNVNSAKSFVYQNELPTADMLTRGLLYIS